MYTYCIEIENAGLIVENLNSKVDKKNNRPFSIIIEKEGVDYACIKRGHNLSNPLPYSTIKNMIIALAGGIPIPTKPKKRNGMVIIPEIPDCIEDAASTTQIKIDRRFQDLSKMHYKSILVDGEYYQLYYYGVIKPKDGEEEQFMNRNKYNERLKELTESDNLEYYEKYGDKDGSIKGFDLFRSQKLTINSNKANTTYFYNLPDGSEKKLKGIYTQDVFDSAFGRIETDLYKKVIRFISQMLGVDDYRTHYTFMEMCQAMYKALIDNKVAQEQVLTFLETIKGRWLNEVKQLPVWAYAIFNFRDGKFVTEGEAYNTSNIQVGENGPASRCSMREFSDVSRGMCYLNAELIFQSNSEELYDAISNWSGVCSCLEGGIARIKQIWSDYLPVMDGYAKISKDDVAEKVEY